MKIDGEGKYTFRLGDADMKCDHSFSMSAMSRNIRDDGHCD